MTDLLWKSWWQWARMKHTCISEHAPGSWWHMKVRFVESVTCWVQESILPSLLLRSRYLQQAAGPENKLPLFTILYHTCSCNSDCTSHICASLKDQSGKSAKLWVDVLFRLQICLQASTFSFGQLSASCRVFKFDIILLASSHCGTSHGFHESENLVWIFSQAVGCSDPRGDINSRWHQHLHCSPNIIRR